METIEAELIGDARFRKYVAEMVVALNFFENGYGNAYNDGVRFGGKFLYDSIMLNEEIGEGEKLLFARDCAEQYMKEKQNEHANSVASDKPWGAMRPM